MTEEDEDYKKLLPKNPYANLTDEEREELRKKFRHDEYEAHNKWYKDHFKNKRIRITVDRQRRMKKVTEAELAKGKRILYRFNLYISPETYERFRKLKDDKEKKWGQRLSYEKLLTLLIDLYSEKIKPKDLYTGLPSQISGDNDNEKTETEKKDSDNKSKGAAL